MKTLIYSYVQYSPRVPLLLLKFEKIIRENFDFVVLSFFLSFFSITHNSKSIRYIRTNHTPNECTTIRDLPFLGQTCTRPKINELQPQTYITVAFLYAIQCVITHTTRKLKVVYGRFTYQTIALLVEISIVLVRAVCAIRLTSNGSKYILQPLSDMTFHVYLYL